MKVTVFQRKGVYAGKVEMEDRAVVCKNILSEGYFQIEGLDEGIFAVMDGVGGVKGSAFASTRVAQCVSEMNTSQKKEEITSKVMEVHEELVTYSKTATTLTGIQISREKALVFHVGNTRLMGFANGYIKCFTEDHTQANVVRQHGFADSEIPEEYNCVLTSCVGGKPNMIDSFSVIDISDRLNSCSKLILTSDGIHDHVPLEYLEKTFNEETSQELLIDLAAYALSCGSEDDLTVMVIEDL